MKKLNHLREYIEILKQHKEVLDVDVETDWNLEIGAVIRRSYDLRAPSPLFNKIKDRIGRVLGAPASLSNQKDHPYIKLALALGLPPATSIGAIIERIATSLEKPPVPPVVVPQAPFHENIHLGEQVDLYKLPVPIIHEHDGGPYINTFGCIVVRSPDGKWTNWSIARIMIDGKNTMTGIVAPTKHLGVIHKMWKDLGLDTPFALALGVEPSIPVVCSMPLPDFVNEGDWLGGFWGEGIHVTPCRTNDLFVPTSAEIVVEGVIAATDTANEGPMGEYSGYSSHEVCRMPRYKVNAVLHRNDPILPVVAAGMPVEEDHTIWGTVTSAFNLYQFRKAGIPVKACFHTWESCMMLMAISLTDGYESVFRNKQEMFDRIASTCFNSRAGVVVPKIAVFNEDIDVYDFTEVARALLSRTHPVSGYKTYDHKLITNLVPYLQCGEIDNRMSTKVIFDCLFDPKIEKRPITASFRRLWPEHIQNRVLQRWKEYGF